MTKMAFGTALVGLCLAGWACGDMPGSPARPTPAAAATADDIAGPVAGATAGAVVDEEPVVRLTDLVAVGSSRLVRTPNGISFNLSTTDLTPDHAYTLWFVVFNEPGQCAVPHECAPDDVVNDAAKPDLIYATGRIASGSEAATFAGRVAVGDTAASINRPVGLPSYGLLEPYDAEVHLAVHHHGAKLPEFMPDMIMTIDGGCSDAGVPAAGVMSPWNEHPFGRRGPNTCATIQAVVHRP